MENVDKEIHPAFQNCEFWFANCIEAYKEISMQTARSQLYRLFQEFKHILVQDEVSSEHSAGSGEVDNPIQMLLTQDEQMDIVDIDS